MTGVDYSLNQDTTSDETAIEFVNRSKEVPTTVLAVPSPVVMVIDLPILQRFINETRFTRGKLSRRCTSVSLTFLRVLSEEIHFGRSSKETGSYLLLIGC